MNDVFKNNTAAKRYELLVGESVAFANYRLLEGTLYIDYVEAPAELRGTGAAGRLMALVMDEVKNEKLKVVPVCGYAAAWLGKHKEYADYMAV